MQTSKLQQKLTGNDNRQRWAVVVFSLQTFNCFFPVYCIVIGYNTNYKTLSRRCRLQLIRTRKLFVTPLLRSYLLGHCQCQVISLLLRNDLGPRSRSCSALSRVIIVHLTRDHDNQLAVFTWHNSREIPLVHEFIRTTLAFLLCPYCRTLLCWPSAVPSRTRVAQVAAKLHKSFSHRVFALLSPCFPNPVSLTCSSQPTVQLSTYLFPLSKNQCGYLSF